MERRLASWFNGGGVMFALGAMTVPPDWRPGAYWPMVAALAAMPVLAIMIVIAKAEPREVLGQAGVLGEWELTATVTERAANGVKELAGPLSLKHVGICTADGP